MNTPDPPGRAVRHSPTVYFASYGLSLLGKGIASVVMPLLVLDRTGDVLAAGILATIATAASAATGLVSGLLVDRIDRRTVSVVSDLLAAVSIAALPVVDALWGLDMTWFLTLAVIGAVIRVPGMTAQETLLPALARLGPATGRLDRLIATRETVGNVLMLAAPGLGGLLVAVLGLSPVLMLVTASTSLLAALTTLLLDPRAGHLPERVIAAGGAVRRAAADLLVSWRFLGGNRLVLGVTLITATLVAVLSSLQSTLMPAYFTAQELPGLTGLTLSAIAGGSIAGSALYAATAGRVRRRTWFVIGMVGLLVGFAAVGSLASPWLVLGGAALVGLTNAPASAVLGVLTVEATPDAMRGRVLGAQNTLMLAAPAVTSAPLAAVAATAGLPVAGAVLAALAGITAIIALAGPGVPLARRPEHGPAEPIRDGRDRGCRARHRGPPHRSCVRHRARCAVMTGPNGGKRLRPVRRRQVLHRFLYTVELPGPGGNLLDHTVEIDAGREDARAALYVDGREQATVDMPGSFPVPDGRIEVSVGLHGVRRIHFVGEDGEERRLDPVPGTLEHLRGRLHRRHPRLSRAVGRLAIAILVVNLVLAVPAALEFLTTRIDRIAELFGTFINPIELPVWLALALAVAGALAGVERVLTLRRNRVLDIETMWTGL